MDYVDESGKVVSSNRLSFFPHRTAASFALGRCSVSKQVSAQLRASSSLVFPIWSTKTGSPWRYRLGSIV